MFSTIISCSLVSRAHKENAINLQRRIQKYSDTTEMLAFGYLSGRETYREPSANQVGMAIAPPCEI